MDLSNPNWTPGFWLWKISPISFFLQKLHAQIHAGCRFLRRQLTIRRVSRPADSSTFDQKKREREREREPGHLVRVRARSLLTAAALTFRSVNDRTICRSSRETIVAARLPTLAPFVSIFLAFVNPVQRPCNLLIVSGFSIGFGSKIKS